MRKILLIILFATIYLLQANAQIQRTFFGCPFGSSEQKVKQVMKSKGLILGDTSEGFRVMDANDNLITFGGHKWECVSFKFYKNKLYQVTFMLTTSYSSSQTIIEQYIRLREQLDEKYAHLNIEMNNEKDAQWGDDNTGLICRYMYLDSNDNMVEKPTNKVNMYLWYYDKNLTGIKYNNDQSEL